MIDLLGMAETRHWDEERGRHLGGGFTLMYNGTEEREENIMEWV